MYPKLRKTTWFCLLVACVVAGTSAAGCGQSDQEQVRRVAQDYIDAIAKGDFASACDLLTPGYRAQLGGEAGCAQAQADQYGSGPERAELDLAGVHVNGDRASAMLDVRRESTGPSPLSLLLSLGEDDRWLIRGQH